MSLARLLAAEIFKPGEVASSRELLEAFANSMHLSSAALVRSVLRCRRIVCLVLHPALKFGGVIVD